MKSPTTRVSRHLITNVTFWIIASSRDDATHLPLFSSPPAILSSTMAELTTVAALYLLWTSTQISCTQTGRRVWVHDILRTRTQLGEYHHLLQELRLDDGRFQRYFRLTLAQFEDLLARVGARISRMDTNYRRSIPAAERLSICLRLVSPPSFEMSVWRDYVGDVVGDQR